MSRTSAQHDAARRRTIAEWISSIFAIFWSVWWGFFMNAILIAQSPEEFRLMYVDIDPYFVRIVYLLLNTFAISFFAFAYTRWLWDIQKEAYGAVKLNKFVGYSSLLVLAIVIVFFGLGLAHVVFKTPVDLTAYGVLLTVMWPFVVVATVWID